MMFCVVAVFVGVNLFVVIFDNFLKYIYIFLFIEVLCCRSICLREFVCWRFCLNVGA